MEINDEENENIAVCRRFSSNVLLYFKLRKTIAVRQKETNQIILSIHQKYVIRAPNFLYRFLVVTVIDNQCHSIVISF